MRAKLLPDSTSSPHAKTMIDWQGRVHGAWISPAGYEFHRHLLPYLSLSFVSSLIVLFFLLSCSLSIFLSRHFSLSLRTPPSTLLPSICSLGLHPQASCVYILVVHFYKCQTVFLPSAYWSGEWENEGRVEQQGGRVALGACGRECEGDGERRESGAVIMWRKAEEEGMRVFKITSTKINPWLLLIFSSLHPSAISKTVKNRHRGGAGGGGWWRTDRSIDNQTARTNPQQFTLANSLDSNWVAQPFLSGVGRYMCVGVMFRQWIVALGNVCINVKISQRKGQLHVFEFRDQRAGSLMLGKPHSGSQLFLSETFFWNALMTITQCNKAGGLPAHFVRVMRGGPGLPVPPSPGRVSNTLISYSVSGSRCHSL